MSCFELLRRAATNACQSFWSAESTGAGGAVGTTGAVEGRLPPGVSGSEEFAPEGVAAPERAGVRERRTPGVRAPPLGVSGRASELPRVGPDWRELELELDDDD